jgi:TetR/AcrR family transcriptional regulator
MCDNPHVPAAAGSSKADRTRARILAAAEASFARRGFADTRLEDVAEQVGLKRAALFYHFASKRELFLAVVEDAFGDLLARIAEILVRPAPLARRIDTAVETWVDAVAQRPSLARLILRQAADAAPELPDLMSPRAAEFLALSKRLLEEGVRSGELRPIRPDPFHVIAAAVGATVFYVTALGSLLPDEPFDPLAPAELATHKRDVVRTVRRLLGVGGARRLRPA